MEELKHLKGILKKQWHAKTLSTKYKGIRFVEKTKAEWKLKKLQKLQKELETKLDSSEDEKLKIKDEIT